MKRFRRIVMWAALAMIGVLVCLSVGGAFLGAESASELFRSVPAAAPIIMVTNGTSEKMMAARAALMMSRPAL